MTGPRDPATHGTRIVLRPIATPLPLGFLALAVATTAFASVQLGWIPQSQGHTIALGVLALTVPMQLLAAVIGFLARDPVAATGMASCPGRGVPRALPRSLRRQVHSARASRSSCSAQRPACSFLA
jgi:hypothetical protein